MKRYNQFTTAFLLTLITYIPTFIWMIDRWTQEETYYSHGFLIPAISILFVWRRRKKLRKIPIKPSNAGWAFFLSGIAIHLISALWQVYFTSGFSMLLTFTGLVLLFLGKDFLRYTWFPIFFLGFMAPLPLVVISHISFDLKMLASRLAVAVVHTIGIPAIQKGSIITTNHSYLVVEDLCSGMRSLIALIALGAFMAYISRLSRIRRIILFIASVPVAIYANVIRITILTLASEIYGAKLMTSTFHDTMSMLVFVFAFVGLFIIGKILE